jgi:hypothetical protein
VTVTALPTGQQRRKAVRATKTAARKAVSILRQLLRRNGPAYLFVRGEVIGITAWVNRRREAAAVGLGVLLIISVFTSWPTAVKWAFIWWAVSRVPRARAERRYVSFMALATITKTPTEVTVHESTLTLFRPEKRKVSPRRHVHVRRWIPLRVRGIPVLPGTIPSRGVLTYNPKWFHDYQDATRRVIFEKVLAQRLRGHRTDIDYGFVWQPGHCRVAFRALPPLPAGKLPYAHQETLPWHRLPVGPARSGTIATLDLLRRPHVILSGAVGSGKTSVAMVWLAHLLRFPHVEVVLIDPARLDFRWASDYVNSYACDLRAMVTALDHVRTEAEQRLNVYETHGDWRDNPLPLFPGMVVILEELAVLVRAVEHRMGTHAANAFRDDLLSLALIARKVNIHLIAIAQQPNADVFDSTEARDQFEWSVLCANPSKEHKNMLSSYGLTLPDLNRPGRVAVIEGQTELTEAHAYWLASPTTPGTSPEDRAEALRWLPDQDTASPATATVTAVTREPVAGQVDAEEVTSPDNSQGAVIPIRRRQSS